MGDQPYPKQFKKPHLHFIYDDEFRFQSDEADPWGIHGPIMRWHTWKYRVLLTTRG